METNPGFLLSILLLIVFFGGAIFFMRQIIGKQTALLDETTKTIKFPYPQQLKMPSKPANVSADGVDTVIKRAYVDWLEGFILTEKDPRRAFLRTGVEQRFLRYQFTSTSLGQALSLVIQTLLAGEDPGAQLRFDRLLSSLMARASRESQALSPWQMTPDAGSPKLNADLHAEAWIAFSTLAATAQWEKSERIDYTSVGKVRLEALYKLLSANSADQPETVCPLYFYDVFQHWQPELDWHAITLKQVAQTEAALSSKDAVLLGDGSNNDASLALQVLDCGWAAILGKANFSTDMAQTLDRLVRLALKSLSNKLENEALVKEYPSGFSNLAVLSACAPMAAALGDQALTDKYWTVLENSRPGFNDPIGASLRLLALMALAGNLWFSSENLPAA